MNKDNESRGYIVDYFISIISTVVLIITVALVLIAIFDKNNSNEAPIGSFDASDFNEGWILSCDGKETEITPPVRINSNRGDEVTLINTLPDNLSDNMSLMMRASMEDLYIYVDGELRAEYAAESIETLEFYIPSAYVVTKLNSEDSGKPIRIDIRFKSEGIINGITLGYGNDVWYSVLKKQPGS